MKAISTAASVAGLMLALAGPAHALSPDEVYARVSPSVWKVVTYDTDGLPLGQGSAVVIDKGTLVANCHVLKQARRVAVRREGASHDAHLALWDPQRDVCQLRVEGLGEPAVALGTTATVQVGHSVYAVGNPKGPDLTLSAGLVSSLRRNPAGQLVLIQTSAAISGGSSGGGLFDDSGRLIGLTTIGSVGADTQNLNFAVPAEWIQELPQRHALRLASGKPASGAAPGNPSAPASPTYRQATISESVNHALEDELAAFDIDRDHILRAEAAGEDHARHRVLDLLLDRALERPRTEHRVEAGLGDLGQRTR